MNGSNRTHVGPSHQPDKYRVVSIVGSGAESTNVWLAVEELDSGSQQVVIKQCAGLPTDEDQEYWTHFGQFARALRHPHLVTVLDLFPGAREHYLGEVSATNALEVTYDRDARPYWYVVMAYEQGDNLAEWLGENPTAKISGRLRMMHTAAGAIDALHAGAAGWGRPVVHGDIKPANVIIRPDGTVVLVDLGLTRIAGGKGRQGRTYAYAAPEIERTGTTVNADKFAFVMLLCHALTGAPPPVGAGTRTPDLDRMEARLRATSTLSARTELLDLIVEAFRAQPDRRPAHLGTWLSSLTGYLSTTSAAKTQEDRRSSRRIAPPMPPTRPSNPRLKTGRQAATAVVAVVLAVVTVAVGGVILPRLLDRNQGPADEAAPSLSSSTAVERKRPRRTTRPKATQTVTVSQTITPEPEPAPQYFGELPAGTHRVNDTGYYTGGGSYQATVSTVVVDRDFLTVNVESTGYSDLRDPDTSCLISDDETVYVFDFRPEINHDDHYKGSLRFINNGLRAPLRFLYSCASDYQEVVLFR